MDSSFYKSEYSELRRNDASAFDFIFENVDGDDEIVDIYLDGIEDGIAYTTLKGESGYILGDMGVAKVIMKYIERLQLEKSILLQKYHFQRVISEKQHEEIIRLETECDNLENQLNEVKRK